MQSCTGYACALSALLVLYMCLVFTMCTKRYVYVHTCTMHIAVVSRVSLVSPVRLQDCVLSFHKHGMQGKSLLTSQVSTYINAMVLCTHVSTYSHTTLAHIHSTQTHTHTRTHTHTHAHIHPHPHTHLHTSILSPTILHIYLFAGDS